MSVVARLNKQLSRGTNGSAGFDLPADHDQTIYPNSSVIIDTGIQINEMKDGYYGQIKSRSGLAFNDGITAFEGVIDSDYLESNIKVLLRNHSNVIYEVKKGDRIAQIIFLKHYDIGDYSVRSQSSGHAGFGSTGQ